MCKKAIDNNPNIRFIIMPVILDLKVGNRNTGHALVLIYDKNKKQCELFDPNGYKESDSWGMGPTQLTIKGIIKDLERTIGTLLSCKIITGQHFCPRYDNGIYQRWLGPQAIQHLEGKQKEGDPEGWCQSWGMWFMHAKMRNPTTNTKQLLTDFEKETQLHMEKTFKNKSFTSFIRAFSDQTFALIERWFDSENCTFIYGDGSDSACFITFIDKLREIRKGLNLNFRILEENRRKINETTNPKNTTNTKKYDAIRAYIKIFKPHKELTKKQFQVFSKVYKSRVFSILRSPEGKIEYIKDILKQNEGNEIKKREAEEIDKYRCENPKKYKPYLQYLKKLNLNSKDKLRITLALTEGSKNIRNFNKGWKKVSQILEKKVMMGKEKGREQQPFKGFKHYKINCTNKKNQKKINLRAITKEDASNLISSIMQTPPAAKGQTATTRRKN